MDNTDIIYNIFQYLEIKELIQNSLINKLFKNACENYFRELITHDYGSIFATFFKFNSYKHVYVTCYRLNNIRKLYTSNDALINFFYLIALDLSDKGIKKLSESIGQLSNLQKLLLGYNKIITLPESIGQLSNLQQLL